MTGVADCGSVGRYAALKMVSVPISPLQVAALPCPTVTGVADCGSVGRYAALRMVGIPWGGQEGDNSAGARSLDPLIDGSGQDEQKHGDIKQHGWVEVEAIRQAAYVEKGDRQKRFEQKLDGGFYHGDGSCWVKA